MHVESSHCQPSQTSLVAGVVTHRNCFLQSQHGFVQYMQYQTLLATMGGECDTLTIQLL